jgi:hypothetical protein
MSRGRFPFWFRAAVVLLFAVLLVPYLLLRNGGIPEAFARSLVERVTPRIKPVLEAQAALSRVPHSESLRGAYYINGMLVQYQTYRAPATAAEVVERFEAAFRKTGFVTKRMLVQGQPTLVAIHPKTLMMLTVRPGDNHRGMLTVRLSQQNLSQLQTDFRADLPGVPAYPGAVGNTLISSAEGSPSRSLTFVAQSSGATVADYYRREMASRGWARLPGPEAGGPDLKILFFAKEGADCSIMLMPAGEGGRTLAMISMTG